MFSIEDPVKDYTSGKKFSVFSSILFLFSIFFFLNQQNHSTNQTSDFLLPKITLKRKPNK